VITLTIYKARDVVYWVERFNTIEECNKWLAVEQTRPYWGKSFTYEIVDNTPSAEVIAAANAAALAAYEAKTSARSVAIAKIKTVCGLSDDEANAL
jgi:hypothetical protein